MFSEKIVVTGMGMVSPLGSDINEAVERLQRGESGVKSVAENSYSPFLANVQDYDATRYVARSKLRRMESLNHYAINAAGDALAMAGLLKKNDQGEALPLEDVGVLVGTGYAGIESVIKHQKCLFDDGIEMLRPVHFPTTVYNATAGMIAIEHQLKGINSTLTGLDMPGEYALLYACILLQKQTDAKILVIGADSYNDRLQQGLYSLGFLTQTKREKPYRAFEKGSDGIIMGEGAGALLLETESSARARGATILAEIAGVFQNSSADQPYNYAATPAAASKVIEQLTQASGKAVADYDLINLSANGVPPLDKLESRLLEKLEVSNTPCRTLSDYIGIFPGAGMLRLLLAIASFKQRRQIQSLQNGNTFSTVEPVLHKPLENFDSFIHLANGLGGNAMAIDVRMVH